jgi:hypothetical protein
LLVFINLKYLFETGNPYYINTFLIRKPTSGK